MEQPAGHSVDQQAEQSRELSPGQSPVQQEEVARVDGSISEDFQSLSALVHAAMASQKPSQECKDINDHLFVALVTNPQSDELKALNYRWQTYLGKAYVREHSIDKFLDGLIQRVLAAKRENPLEEMYRSLDPKRKADTA